MIYMYTQYAPVMYNEPSMTRTLDCSFTMSDSFLSSDSQKKTNIEGYLRNLSYLIVQMYIVVTHKNRFVERF